MQSIYTINSIFLIRIGLGTNANREECLKARPNEQKLNVLLQCWSARESILTTGLFHQLLSDSGHTYLTAYLLGVEV